MVIWNQRKEVCVKMADVTILEIHSQIHKINPPRTDARNEVLQVLIRHLVGNILDHHRCSGIQSSFNLLNVQLVLLGGIAEYTIRVKLSMEGTIRSLIVLGTELRSRGTMIASRGTRSATLRVEPPGSDMGEGSR